MGIADSHMSKMMSYFLTRDNIASRMESICAAEQKFLNTKIRAFFCDKAVSLLSQDYPEQMKIFPIVYNKMYSDYIKYKKCNQSKRSYTKSITWIKKLPYACRHILDILCQAIYSETLQVTGNPFLNIHLREIYCYHIMGNFIVKYKRKNQDDAKKST